MRLEVRHDDAPIGACADLSGSNLTPDTSPPKCRQKITCLGAGVGENGAGNDVTRFRLGAAAMFPRARLQGAVDFIG